MSSPKLAVVTRVYNEPDYLPIWTSYYGAQVGPRHCYIIDHGSDDGSTDDLAAFNLLRIPRSPVDEVRFATFNSEFCASLLLWYDAVLYGDVDEMIIPDPRYHASLLDYCAATSLPVVNAIGMNVIHRPQEEPSFDPRRRVLEQRHWVFHASSACKVALIRRPVMWSPGFHSSDSPVAFDRLYNFHLRWFDLPTALRRLQKTRTMPWQDPNAGSHARIADEAMVEQFRGFGGLPPLDADLDQSVPPVSTFCRAVEDSQIGREHDVFKISLDIWPNARWRIPERFSHVF